MTTFDLMRIGLFIAATTLLLIISQRSLRSRNSHGFYRFFAWEAILTLVLLNLPDWFVEPLSLRQCISWLSLCSSLVVLWLGYSQLRYAKRTALRTEPDLFAFERTSQLVTTGIYRLIRHPLYASLLYLAWGAWLKAVTWPTTILAVAASWFVLATAQSEERECRTYFGDAYERYMKTTKRFVPFLF
jgi:protein-S-isoprenylcysteine O-methyltransferase Ste14